MTDEHATKSYINKKAQEGEINFIRLQLEKLICDFIDEIIYLLHPEIRDKK